MRKAAEQDKKSDERRAKELVKKGQDKAAEILGKNKLRYTYENFPSKFREDCFSTPRPLPAAVITEFDRQKKDAAQFRRKKSALQPKDKGKLQRVDPVSVFGLVEWRFLV